MMRESFLYSVGSSVLWNSSSRVAGLSKHIVVATTLGLNAQLDVFYMLMAILGILLFSWGEMLDVLSVPRLARYFKDDDHQRFERLARDMNALSLILSLGLGLLLIVSSPLTSLFTAGFEQERKILLEQSKFWMLPVVLFYLPMRQIGARLRAQRRFSSFYQAEFIGSCTILASILIHRNHPFVLFWSFVAGTAASLLYLWFRARPSAFQLGNPFSAQIRELLGKGIKLLATQGLQYTLIFVDRVFVSFLSVGSVSAVAYGLTIVKLGPNLTFFQGAFITILAENDDKTIRSNRLNELILTSIFLGYSIGFFLFLFDEKLVSIILERGAFTAQNTTMVATVLTAYSLMVIPLFLIGPIDQVFQVENRIGLILRRYILGLICNIIFNAWFLFGLNLGVFGIALATAISYWLMLLSNFQALDSLQYKIDFKGHILSLSWTAIFSLFPFAFVNPSVLSDRYALIETVVAILIYTCWMIIGAIINPFPQGQLFRRLIHRMTKSYRLG